MFKRIYVEITNICNLKCSFCSNDKRKKQSLSPEQFEHILKSIKPYTDLIYLHIKGEPLLHPNLNQILELTKKYNVKVKITTNGTLLKDKLEILNKYKIEQINISLQCEHNNPNYLENIFKSVEKLNTTIVYRIWLLKEYNETNEILNKIKEYYKIEDITSKNIKIKDNLYIDKDLMFVWPNEGEYCSNKGKCYATKTHIGILSNGEVVPCCLDSEGTLSFGNIFEKSLKEILESKEYIEFNKDMQNNIMKNKLCQHCNFKERL